MRRILMLCLAAFLAAGCADEKKPAEPASPAVPAAPAAPAPGPGKQPAPGFSRTPVVDDAAFGPGSRNS